MIDHERVLHLAIESLPAPARPRPKDCSSPSYVVRADAAGATHRFARACVEAGCGFSFGVPITAAVRGAVVALEDEAWSEAIEEDGGVRDGALVAEVTRHLDLSQWPVGSQVIVRKERPHPGAQLSLFDVEAGWRHTAFICAPRPGAGRDERPIAVLEVRHRGHVRMEDRIRQAKAAGLSNLACRDLAENEAWLECVLAAADLLCWSTRICFAEDPELARCEIAAFGYRILHMATRLARSGRSIHLRLDRHWAWAKQLALGFERHRAAFA